LRYACRRFALASRGRIPRTAPTENAAIRGASGAASALALTLLVAHALQHLPLLVLAHLLAALLDDASHAVSPSGAIGRATI
jgi:hypothetical protein